MKIVKLKQLALSASILGMLLTGCSNTGSVNPEPVTTETTTETTTEEPEVIKEEAMDVIYNNYIEKSNEMISKDSVIVDKINDAIIYQKEENGLIVYEYGNHIARNYKELGYSVADDNNESLYCVKLKTYVDGDQFNVPIAGFAKIDGEIVNVKVTTLDNNGVYHKCERNKYYIIIFWRYLIITLLLHFFFFTIIVCSCN